MSFYDRQLSVAEAFKAGPYTGKRKKRKASETGEAMTAQGADTGSREGNATTTRANESPDAQSNPAAPKKKQRKKKLDELVVIAFVEKDPLAHGVEGEAPTSLPNRTESFQDQTAEQDRAFARLLREWQGGIMVSLEGEPDPAGDVAQTGISPNRPAADPVLDPRMDAAKTEGSKKKRRKDPRPTETDPDENLPGSQGIEKA